MDMRKYQFKEQERGEVVFKILHRHWFNLLMQFVPLAGITFLLVVMFGVISNVFENEFPFVLILFLFSFILLCVWLVASIIWVNYYLDVWIITNKRVVNIEQKGLFFRHISELRYYKIQDVTTEVTGLIPTLLNYGDVFIQTAGTQPRFLFHKIAEPNRIKDQLIFMQKRTRKKDIAQVRNIIHNTRES